MLSAFMQAFKTPDLRRKLLFTLGIMAPVSYTHLTLPTTPYV